MMSTKTPMGKPVLAIALSGIWVNAFEFVRNQFLLQARWEGHYQGIGLVFPAAPVNGAMWVAWGFVFAGAVFALTRRFGLWPATLLGWVMGFVMMWVVIWNLSVLPLSILPLAIPMSFIEVFGAAFICRRLVNPGSVRATGAR
jgi:hypothetical protein